MRTKDRDEAKRLIPYHTLKTQAEIDSAEQARRDRPSETPVTAPEKPVRRVSPRAARLIEEFDTRAEEGVEIDAREAARREAGYDARAPRRDRLMKAFLKRTAERTDLENAAVDLIRDLRFDLTVEREQRIMATIQSAERRRGLSSPPVKSILEAKTVLASSVPLLSSFDSYAAEQGIEPNTRYEWRRNLSALVNFLGHDDAARITVEDLDRWTATLLKETTNRGRLRTPRTLKDKYVSSLRATLNWLVEKRKLKENVAAQIVVRVPRKAVLRDWDFTKAEAKAILSATLKAPAGNVGPKTVLARRWIPWLCAYTGARVNEISQLRGKDVTQIDGIWTIRITPEAGTVKANAARIVPLHPHLIEQDFPAVAKAAGDAPIFYDPTRTRRPGEGNRHLKKVGERLRDWVRDDLNITDPGSQPNHAWRHTFKTLSRSVDMPERVADAIQGHAARSVGQSYGSVPLRTLADAIAKLPRFEVENRE